MPQHHHGYIIYINIATSTWVLHKYWIQVWQKMQIFYALLSDMTKF